MILKYRCRMCGEVFIGAIIDLDLIHAMEYLKLSPLNPKNMYNIHFCGTDSNPIGIADLIGAEKETKGQTP